MLGSLNKIIRYKLFRQSWNIGVAHAPIATVAGLLGEKKQAAALHDILWMKTSRKEFRADPFIMSLAEGQFRIFYENLRWSENRGTIYRVDWSDEGFGKPNEVRRERHHLSYPFLFGDAGEMLVLPEEGEARQFRAFSLSGEGEWCEPRPILHGKPLIDSTLVHHSGRIWLFATLLDDGENEALHIFHAGTLNGPWTSHPGNPVKRDRSNARPAGQFFRHKGALFRPAQNCARFYGECIVINEVRRLNDESFEEVPAAELRMPEGSEYNYGCHTLSHASGVCVIDAARLESRIAPVFDRLGSIFR